MNVLIYMYAKCESIEKASRLFEKMHDAYIVSWFAIIVRYAQDEFSKRGLE